MQISSFLGLHNQYFFRLAVRLYQICIYHADNWLVGDRQFSPKLESNSVDFARFPEMSIEETQNIHFSVYFSGELKFPAGSNNFLVNSDSQE